LQSSRPGLIIHQKGQWVARAEAGSIGLITRQRKTTLSGGVRNGNGDIDKIAVPCVHVGYTWKRHVLVKGGKTTPSKG